MRRLISVVAVLLLLSCSIARADPAPTSQPAAAALDPAIPKSVDAAVKFIVSRQNKDGALCDTDNEQTAITALSIMAIKSTGTQVSQHTDAANAMRKAMTWMLQDARLRPDGYFGNDGSWMYTHGVVTLMLAQMSGSGADQNQNALIKNRLTKAVDLILEAQKTNQAGAWRYGADSADADICVTLWQIRALAAARQAGISVPPEVFASAADFVKSCAADTGGFAYVPGRPAGWSRSAAGLMALQLCGQADSPEAKSAFDYLQARARPGDRVWYLYACPAYVAAMGAASPDDLETARGNVADTVLQFQNKDGSFDGWDTDSAHGRVYCTALVILSMTARPVAIEPAGKTGSR
jgi:prenyltransferase beta subunit